MLAFRMDEKTLQMMTATDNHTKTTERVRSGIEEAPNEDLRKTIDELAGIVYYMITNKLKMTSCFGQSTPHVQWCMMCMYFLNKF